MEVNQKLTNMLKLSGADWLKLICLVKLLANEFYGLLFIWFEQETMLFFLK